MSGQQGEGDKLTGDMHAQGRDHHAKVIRKDEKSEFIDQAAEALRSIGKAMQSVDAGAKACQYVGSMAVHIYKSEVLGEVVFFSQVSTLGQCPEQIASDAISDLSKQGMIHFGRQAPKKRSGF